MSEVCFLMILCTNWSMFFQIIAVDKDGNTWIKIQKPHGDAISIHEVHGQLCVCTADNYNMTQLSI
jgi:hypothetical protein